MNFDFEIARDDCIYLQFYNFFLVSIICSIGIRVHLILVSDDLYTKINLA